MTTTPVHDAHEPALLGRLCHNLTTKCRVASDRLLVAVSGGPDSVALLRLLVEARPQFGYEIVVAHFDHRLRPRSPDDAQFVRELAARLGLEVHVGTWNDPCPGEAAARDARLGFLQRTAQRFGCTLIVLGHQLDDQIETVLMRLGRGSGPRGLAGMHWRRRAPIDIVRPLLDCPRDELVAYLRSVGQPWCDDASNTDLTKSRNRVRHLVIPALDAALGAGWRKRWSAGLAEQQALTSWLQRTAVRVVERAARDLPEVPGLEVLDLAPLRRLSPTLRRAVLQHWLDPVGTLGLRRLHLVRASALVRGGRSGERLDLPGRMVLRIEGARLVREVQVGMPTPATDSGHGAEAAAATSDPPPFTLEVQPIEPRAALQTLKAKADDPKAASGPPSPPLWFPGNAAAFLCVDRTSPPFEVRDGKAGEKVRLLGAPGSRRLTRILQDKRVPPRLRSGWPVVADAQGIVWIPGIGIAERCRLDPSSSQARHLQLRAASPDPVRLAEVHDQP